jgi:hypothetical protein
MSSGNRTVKYENLLKSLRKHYRPLADPPERSVLEHLLYGCCLEDARIDQADEGFAKLQQTYFDWNEVRVTTVAELAEALKPLPFPSQAASRIKQCLQSIFETRYQYDIDDMKKANLGKATAELKAWKGMSPFVVSYVSQHALGGHSIPASNLICDAMWQCDILTLAELQKKSLPGVERAIPKNKGVEFAGLLLQFASDLYHHPRGSAPLAVLKEMGATYKTKPKPEAQASDSKAKGSKTSAAKLAPEKTSGTPEPEVKKSEPAASASKVAPKQPAAKGSAAKAPATKAPAGKETPTSNKVAVSKDTKSPNKATSKVDSKVGAKPTSSKADASKNDKNAKPKAEASKPAKPAQVKGKPEKGKQDKGKPSYSKAQSSKLEKGKPEKSKPEKGKTQQAKPEKSALEKPKSDKSKPIKKESKDSGKSTKAPVKGNHSSVGTSLTKKKPR